MREAENIALVKRGLEALEKGDYEALRPLMTDDTVWISPFEPDYHGPDEVIASMKRWSEEFGVTTKDEPEGFFADDDRVVSLDHVTATRNGRTLDTHVVHVYEIRNGKLWRLTEYTADPQKTLEFMS